MLRTNLTTRCSYNMLNGVPTCGNPVLNHTLREDWGYEGYITADTDACDCIVTNHSYVSDAQQAVRVCLEGGTDIDSGHWELRPPGPGSLYARNLSGALASGTISKKLADAALTKTQGDSLTQEQLQEESAT